MRGTRTGQTAIRPAVCREGIFHAKLRHFTTCRRIRLPFCAENFQIWPNELLKTGDEHCHLTRIRSATQNFEKRFCIVPGVHKVVGRLDRLVRFDSNLPQALNLSIAQITHEPPEASPKGYDNEHVRPLVRVLSCEKRR